ncbi:MAG: peptidase domain-containing ABC transporter [Candidatus Magnetomorum sp.]|nr:peptidase domain-containing ABC transporter [Candidatus Magnetomorum sp.]
MNLQDGMLEHQTEKIARKISGHIKKEMDPSLIIDLPKPEVKPRRRFWVSRSSFPFIRQQSRMDCGAACLTMVCDYYGIRPSINKIKELLNVSRNGTSMMNILRGVEIVGFKALAYKSTWEQLQQACLPAIANWKGYHWVVIYRVDKDKITVGDPAESIKTYSREEFEKSWVKYTIFLSPTKKFKELQQAKRNFKYFIPYILKQKILLLEILLMSLSMQFFAICLPLVNMHVINNVIIKSDIRLFLPSIAVVSLFIFLNLMLMYFRQNLILYIGRKIGLSLLSDFYKHLLSLPMHYFENRTVGDITTRFGQNDIVISFLVNGSIQIILDFITAIIVSILFFAISPFLMTVTFCIILFDIFQVVLTSPIIQKNYQEAYVRLSETQTHLIEALTNMRTIKNLGIGHIIRWKNENLYIHYLNTQLKSEVIFSIVESGASFLTSLTNASIIFVGAYMIFEGNLSIGALVAFLSLVGYVRNPLISIVNSWDTFQETLNAVERLGDIYDSKPEEDESKKDQLIDLPLLKGDIQFNDVTFRYEEDAQNNVLQNIHLLIRAGEKVAFVGRSGSGKSTIVKLIYGFYTPNSGSITIDSFNYQDCRLHSLRRQMGVILQKDVLFDGSIRDNISRGNPSAHYENILEASKSAAAHEFISNLPDGYETILKDEASNLSEGQRQRIIIARTLLQNPNILIMDEGTSALDNESERFVMDQIFEKFKDRTVLIIAHRLSTIQKCDKIHVIDKGTIIESGTHEELKQKRGMYHLLLSQQ